MQSYKLLYALQVIYSLLGNYRSVPANVVTLYREKHGSSHGRPQLWENNNSQGGAGAGNYERNFPSFEESKANESKPRQPPLDQIMEDDSENNNENILGLVNSRGNTDSDRPRKHASHNIAAGSGEPIALQDAATVENDNRQAPNYNSQTDRFGK